MARQPSRLLLLGYYMQMLAAFLLLTLTHYFTAAFLPIADCDETYNFVEPAHYVLYGTGKQTWENCPQFALRSWLFVWVYAWPAALVRGASTLASVDVYYYLRLFNGRLVAVTQLYLVYSVWAAFSGKVAMVTLLVLLLNYPIPHAAVSVLPTSFVMACYFVALGSWLRTAIPSREAPSDRTVGAAAAPTSPRTAAAASLFYPTTTSKRGQRTAVVTTVFFVVLAGVLGWPFAGLVGVPIGLDLLIRFPGLSVLCLAVSLVGVVSASVAVDAFYYCRPVLVAWNIVKYNVFGGAGRGPELYGTEPWFYFFKNLLLNFHLAFLAALLAPLIVLVRRPRGASAATPEAPARRRGRQLLFISPFFLWFTFWLAIPHKEERFMAPAYPFMALAASLAITYLFFPDTPSAAPGSAASPTRRHSHRGKGHSRAGLRYACGLFLLMAFGVLSFSRALAIYHFYSAPERALYDWYLAVQREAALKLAETGSRYRVCVGKEWYRFPSSFFLDSRYAEYQFLKTASFSGMLPVAFPPTTATSGGDTAATVHWTAGLLRQDVPAATATATAAALSLGTCHCGAAAMNDLNEAIPEQYVDVATCDAVFDSVVSEEEARELQLAHFPLSIFSSDVLQRVATHAAAAGPHAGQFYHPRSEEAYRLLDVDHTPMWCRVLYYPFGISGKCARWRTLVFQARRLYTAADVTS